MRVVNIPALLSRCEVFDLLLDTNEPTPGVQGGDAISLLGYVSTPPILTISLTTDKSWPRQLTRAAATYVILQSRTVEQDAALV
jgi:hypothetical protein